MRIKTESIKGLAEQLVQVAGIEEGVGVTVFTQDKSLYVLLAADSIEDFERLITKDLIRTVQEGVMEFNSLLKPMSDIFVEEGMFTNTILRADIDNVMEVVLKETLESQGYHVVTYTELTHLDKIVTRVRYTHKEYFKNEEAKERINKAVINTVLNNNPKVFAYQVKDTDWDDKYWNIVDVVTPIDTTFKDLGMKRD